MVTELTAAGVMRWVLTISVGVSLLAGVGAYVGVRLASPRPGPEAAVDPGEAEPGETTVPSSTPPGQLPTTEEASPEQSPSEVASQTDLTAINSDFVNIGLRFDRSMGEAGGCQGRPSNRSRLETGTWYEVIDELGRPVDDPTAEPLVGQRVRLVLWDQDHELDDPLLVRVHVTGPSGDLRTVAVLQPRDAATVSYPIGGDDSAGLNPGLHTFVWETAQGDFLVCWGFDVQP